MSLGLYNINLHSIERENRSQRRRNAISNLNLNRRDERTFNEDQNENLISILKNRITHEFLNKLFNSLDTTDKLNEDQKKNFIRDIILKVAF
jgi:hypothetical protein